MDQEDIIRRIAEDLEPAWLLEYFANRVSRYYPGDDPENQAGDIDAITSTRPELEAYFDQNPLEQQQGDVYLADDNIVKDQRKVDFIIDIGGPLSSNFCAFFQDEVNGGLLYRLVPDGAITVDEDQQTVTLSLPFNQWRTHFVGGEQYSTKIVREWWNEQVQRAIDHFAPREQDEVAAWGGHEDEQEQAEDDATWGQLRIASVGFQEVGRGYAIFRTYLTGETVDDFLDYLANLVGGGIYENDVWEGAVSVDRNERCVEYGVTASGQGFRVGQRVLDADGVKLLVARDVSEHLDRYQRG